jgi:hypothetical protein
MSHPMNQNPARDATMKVVSDATPVWRRITGLISECKQSKKEKYDAGNV